MRFLSAILLGSFLLSGCVGGTLSDKSEVEDFPLRAATDSEGKNLKICLRAAYAAQEGHKQKTGKYYRRLSEMKVDAYCSGFKLSQNRTEAGYEIRAQFSEGDTAVRWSINQNGVIEEHLDPEYDMDLEF